MKQPLFDKGNTEIVRISALERVVTQLMRRSRKTAKAIITPYPISSCVSGDDVKGDILKYMFPTDGIITKCLIHLDKKVKGGAVIVIDKIRDGQRTRRDFLFDKAKLEVNPDIGMLAGDKLIVSIDKYTDEAEPIKEVWVSFLWVPHVSTTKVKQHLIEELDAVEEEFKVR